MEVEFHLIHPDPGNSVDDFTKWGVYVIDENVSNCVAVTHDYKLADELKKRAIKYIINYSTGEDDVLPFESDQLIELQNKMFQDINSIIEQNNKKLSISHENYGNVPYVNLHLYRGNKKYKLVKIISDSTMIMELESVGNKILSLVNEMKYFHIKNDIRFEIFNNEVHYVFDLGSRVSIVDTNYIKIFNKTNEEMVYNWEYASVETHSIVYSFIIDLFKTLKGTGFIYKDIYSKKYTSVKTPLP